MHDRGKQVCVVLVVYKIPYEEQLIDTFISRIKIHMHNFDMEGNALQFSDSEYIFLPVQ